MLLKKRFELFDVAFRAEEDGRSLMDACGHDIENAATCAAHRLPTRPLHDKRHRRALVQKSQLQDVEWGRPPLGIVAHLAVGRIGGRGVAEMFNTNCKSSETAICS